MGSGGFYSLLKLLLGAIATAVFFWLLSVGSMESGATKTWTAHELQPTKIFKHEEVIGRGKLVYNPKLNHNYMMSKRRVPNGPDPIHNRRAGNSKRPPGQA